MKWLQRFLVVSTSLLLVAGGYLWFSLIALERQYEELTAQFTATTADLASSTAYNQRLMGTLAHIQDQLMESQSTNEELAGSLTDEKIRNEAFKGQIENISGTVGQLDKLSKTDPELLQKYSKVFFLNENYVPEKLRQLDKKYIYNEDKPEFLGAEVIPFFEDMVQAAKDDNINLWVISAYRSFDTQAALKGEYLVTYGTGANTFSADQGYSEHQLGTTIDFTTSALNGRLEGFETTPAYEWLTKHAHTYGFVLSYSEQNGYYVFEPWHWRFVGTDLARDLHSDEKNFYDLDQRKIDEYLISIFD